MAAVGIIPARYASSRFPGKPLANILGKPMIQHVYEQAKQAKLLDQVLVATDDDRIFKAVQNFAGKAQMTSQTAANGTERVAEVAANLSHELIVNIQGDEPLIDPKKIDQLINLMVKNPDAVVGTLVKRINKVEDLTNPNIPKVVVDKDFNALYFSRAIIPFNRDGGDAAQLFSKTDFYQHIGIYIYRRDFLLQLVKFPPTKLEKVEQLEQLRILENGYKIKVAVTETSSIGVDMPADIAKVERYLMEKIS